MICFGWTKDMGKEVHLTKSLWLILLLPTGFGPWVINFSFFSIRIKLISTLFYVTWVTIRCGIYPYILKILWKSWENAGFSLHSRYAVATFLHCIFCVLNFKVSKKLLFSRHLSYHFNVSLCLSIQWLIFLIFVFATST